MRTEDALKLIDEVQIVGSARGWDMREKLLYLVHRATLAERKACCEIVDTELDSNGQAEAIKLAIRARAQSPAQPPDSPPLSN